MNNETYYILQKNPMFHTPEHSEELMDYIEKLSGGEKTAATVVAMMMWNLCAELTKQIDKSKGDTNA